MAAAPSMREAGEGGAIVLISSTQGLKGTGGDGSAAVASYAAAKHGMFGLMRSFANWLAQDNIRVNTLHPTVTIADFVTWVRVMRAADLSRTSGRSVASVNEAVGYSSPSAFSKAFQSALGTPPGRFARTARD